MPIPDLLWQRAWRLGEAHNHEWTLALRSVTGADAMPPPISCEMLAAIVDQYRREYVRADLGAGVDSPFRAEWIDGYWGPSTHEGRRYDSMWHYGWEKHSASHRTGTGRCRWAIDHEGVVTISISRPGDVDVLTVVVAIDGSVQWAAEASCGVRYGARHVEAAVRELTALGVDAAVPARIAEEAAFTDHDMPALAASIAQIDHWEDRAEQALRE